MAFGFLVVCVINVMALLMARSLQHWHQLGLHRALGAHRLQVMGQCLAEALLLGGGGALLGLVFAATGLGLSAWINPLLEPIAILDFWMVISTLTLAMIAALLAGLLPAWRASRLAPAVMLGET